VRGEMIKNAESVKEKGGKAAKRKVREAKEKTPGTQSKNTKEKRLFQPRGNTMESSCGSGVTLGPWSKQFVGEIRKKKTSKRESSAKQGANEKKKKRRAKKKKANRTSRAPEGVVFCAKQD